MKQNTSKQEICIVICVGRQEQVDQCTVQPYNEL